MKSVAFSASFAFLMLIGLALVLAWRSHDQQRLDDARRDNCTAIEQLKQIQRAALLEDIAAARAFVQERTIPGLDNALIEESIRRDEQTLRQLAPKDC